MERRKFGRDSTYLLAAIVAGIMISIPRLAPGIPQGVDSTSHLSKILFMFNWYTKLGYIPSWYPDWYGGSPFLLLYSPLSYFLTFGVTYAGIDAVAAYKLVDSTFFVLTPLSVYLLGRELNLGVKEAAVGSLLFVLTPTVVGNYLFYDRFPNVVALPITCLFLTALSRMLQGKKVIQTFVISTVLLAILILTHHLSALLALIIMTLALFSFTNSSKKLKKTLPLFLAVIVGAVAISSPWLLNFLRASAQISENPFYNRDVQFPFIRLTYALNNYLTVEQGMIHFILAMVAIYIWFSKGYHISTPTTLPIISVFFGMGVFEFGGAISAVWELIGQVFVILGLLSLVSLILYVSKKIKHSDTAGLFLVLWFTVFFWLGLGYYAVPLANFPLFQSVWRSLDVHRFWLYLSIPVALLAGKVLVRMARSSAKKTSLVALTMILTLIVVGAGVKATYSLIQNVNPHFPYTTQNSEIPQQLLTYFKSKEDFGRILPVRCPFWVYLLPSYSGKPLIDGWYPQEKLLPFLLNISDYRIDDLENTNNRVETWERIIEKNQELGIRWVLVGNSNSTLINHLSNSTFRQNFSVMYGGDNLTVLENTIENSPIQLLDTPEEIRVRYDRPTPDKIIIDIDSRLRNVELIVREAYHSGWTAYIDGERASIQATKEDRLMLIPLEYAPTRIVITHSNPGNPYIYLSLTTLVALALFCFSPGIGKKRL
jgi:hypothetical protein